MLSRRSDWSVRLYAAVDQAMTLPFIYGVHDCCLWAARCVDVMCDTTFVRDIAERFNYRDADSANAVLEQGGGMLALVTEFLGEHSSPKYAAPGDVVLARNGDGLPIIGVIVGHSVVVPGERGAIVLPYDSAIVCWKV